MDAIEAFRANALNPNHPQELGSAQNPDDVLTFKTESL